MSRPGQAQAAAVEAAPAPAFDDDASEALAIVTLLVTGEQRDLDLAGVLLDEMMDRPGGDRRVAHGMSSVCSGLVALLEFFGGLSPRESLRELGRLIAEAKGDAMPTEQPGGPQ